MSTSRLTRRTFLSAAALAVAGCGSRSSSGSGEFTGQQLRVFVYGGGHEKTMRESFVPAFEKETGATAILESGWWDAIAKLKASPADRPAFDLVITDATQGYPAIREGLFAQLDLDLVPNHKSLVPSALDNWVYRERYAIPYPDSVMTLAYHRELVEKPPANWGDLLRDDLHGKIALYKSFYMSLFTFACMKSAREGKPGTAHELVEKDLQGILKFARDHREQVKFWWPTSTDMILSLTRKDCAAGNMHSPEYLQAMRAEKQLAAVVPPDRPGIRSGNVGHPRGHETARAGPSRVEPDLQRGIAIRLRTPGFSLGGAGRRRAHGGGGFVLEEYLPVYPRAARLDSILPL